MKPILFNTSMVQAILDGRKTVTRRLIKPQPEADQIYPLGCCVDGDKRDIGKFGFGSSECGGRILYVRPPYKAGDVLYVRETYCPNYFCEYIAGTRSGEMRGNRNAYKTDYHKEVVGDIVPEPKWKPSIHMPKEAARIFLRVTSVRVEHLQEITPDQATREGIKLIFPPFQIDEFIDIWNLTIKKPDVERYSWIANPWVWVIEFERCEKPEDKREGKGTWNNS